MTQRLNLVAIIGSPSKSSRTKALVDAIVAAIELPGNTQLTVIELSQIWREVGTTASRDSAVPAVSAALDAIESADLLVAASPVYKGSYTGLFKHLIDLVHPDALVGRPVLLAATGGSDRHALAVDHQLRTLFAFFRAYTVPSAVYGAEADFDNGAIRSEALRARVQEAADQAAALLRRVPARAPATQWATA